MNGRIVGVKLQGDDLQKFEAMRELAGMTDSQLLRTLVRSVENVTPAKVQVRPMNEVRHEQQHESA